jgi:predicted short-subunit dehydrogenase-like oxidoreductase (DUF2520 family)
MREHSPGKPEMAARVRVAVTGAGRLGTALARALRRAGWEVDGPAGRGASPDGDALILCVPDGEIAAAAGAAAGKGFRFVGHTSGATPLTALDQAGSHSFGLHPLQSFPGRDDDADRFEGAGCAIAGSSPEALDLARELATSLRMTPFEIADADRPAYHAAASIASNFLVTLEAAAERVAATAGLAPEQARRLLAPLVRATVDSWAAAGPEKALTGPVVRGDELTVASQRAAVRRADPRLLPLFDALVEETRRVAGPDARKESA